jgi:hypothetical protein
MNPGNIPGSREDDIAVRAAKRALGDKSHAMVNPAWAPLQLADDPFERETHAVYAVLLSGRPVRALMPLRFACAQRFLAAREIRFRPSAER